MLLRLFYLYPILEVLSYAFFIALFGLPIAIIFGLSTFLLGLSILRGKGLMLLTKEMRAGNMNNFQAFNLSMLAGFLLVIPGFITNFVGLFLLIPAIFQLITNRKTSDAYHTSSKQNSESEQQEGNVIDGEYHVVDNDKDNT